MSAFDPATFLSATMDQPLEKRSPLPEGDYIGVIGKPEIRVNAGKKDPSKTYIFLDIPITVEVPADLQASLSLPPTLTVRDSLILDQTAAGGLDMSPGRNTGLRRYREALDLNKPGDSFSISGLEGRPIRAKVRHELYNEQIQERVGGIAAV